MERWHNLPRINTACKWRCQEVGPGSGAVTTHQSTVLPVLRFCHMLFGIIGRMLFTTQMCVFTDLSTLVEFWLSKFNC